MTEYYMYGLSLADGQIKKIISSANKHESVTIRLSRDNFTGKHKLLLTKAQIDRLHRAKTGVNLTLSYSQIKNINDIVSSIQKNHDGIIPLLALIPIIASALGAAGGVASSVSASNNAKAAATAQAELERHNGEVEAQLKTGSGVISDYAGKTPMIGNLFKPILQKLGLANRTFQRCIHA